MWVEGVPSPLTHNVNGAVRECQARHKDTINKDEKRSAGQGVHCGGRGSLPTRFNCCPATTLTKHGLCTAGKAGRLHKDTTPPTHARGKQGPRCRGGDVGQTIEKTRGMGEMPSTRHGHAVLARGEVTHLCLVWRVALCPSIKIVIANVMALGFFSWFWFRFKEELVLLGQTPTAPICVPRFSRSKRSK